MESTLASIPSDRSRTEFKDLFLGCAFATMQESSLQVVDPHPSTAFSKYTCLTLGTKYRQDRARGEQSKISKPPHIHSVFPFVHLLIISTRGTQPR
jgi:hypothetical protein